jgi:DNA-directed RNA polymerase beta' subunit
MEMNMHLPQSVEAATELREIAAVPKQLISPRLSKPLVSVVQDTLVGVNRLTRPTEFFTRREFMNLLVHSKRWDGRIPPPAKTDPLPLWSGQQVVSALLPAVYINMGNKMWNEEKGKSDPNYVIIQNGTIQQGILDGDVFDKALIHILYNDFSPEMTVDFLDSLQAVVAAYLQNSGFSVGLSDLIADGETLTSIGVDLTQLKKQIEALQLQVHMGLFDNTSGRSNQEEFEMKVFETLNKAINAAGKTGLKSLSANNRMVNMVKCGSKGSDINIAQMIALLGQQSIEGKRIAYGFQDRTLPHFKRYDDGAEARGFIESSFVKGLTPAEFFFHAMTGREGLIDTAVKTADSGYMQRQLVKTMEDLMTYHDGSVRDAGGLLVQFAYGDDGTSATKIENQPIALGKMTDTEIRTKFTIDDVASEKSQAYLSAVFADRDMLVRNVWGNRVEGSVQSAAHLPRLIANAVQQLSLAPGQGTPVDGGHVLDTINRIHQRTRGDNALWGALLRYHLNPKALQGLGFTRAAFDWLAEQIVVKHLKSWVVPGEMAGIISAQSIGEPTTQLTLNSVDWDTEIIIARDGKLWTPKIGEFIDAYIADCESTAPERIQRLANDQLYVSLEGDGHVWQALSPNEDGQMMWTTLEAITKHPVINEDGSNTILEVELESGRIVKATKAKSFLRLEGDKIVACNGSDLKIGDQIPIANNLRIPELGVHDQLVLRDYLPPTEWLYGTDATAALAAMRSADASNERHWFSHANGRAFTVPYSRSDAFRDAFTKGKNRHADAIRPGFVYPKKLWTTISQIPDTIPLTREFGYFCGAYLAEGNSNATQVMITNNEDAYLAPVRTLMDAWEVGHHTVSAEKHALKTGIIGHTQSLVIHSTLLAAVLQRAFGRVSYEKTIPDWVFQAPDDFVKGLVDGYIGGDGCVHKDKSVTFSSVSKPLVDRMAILLSRYGIFGTHSRYMPHIGKFDNVSVQNSFRIPMRFTQLFAATFTLTIGYKQERLDAIRAETHTAVLRRTIKTDTVLDAVKRITEISPMTDRVYDVTVEATRNFITSGLVAVRDTFHLSGVAAKSGMTRGVPRIKELFKATQNPRATSLTIYLRPDIRTSQQDARRLAQELEFTMLKDLVSVARIYFDPRDSATLIAEDQEWLAFFAAFESSQPATANPSPWILRLELDREKMFNKGITMEDIQYVLRKVDSEISVTYTDHNASRMVFRVRFNKSDDKNALNDLTAIKQIQNRLLTQTLVRGLPGLRAVGFRKLEGAEAVYEKNPANDNKYEPVQQFVLDTFGTNFLDVMIHPDVDGTRLISNHLYDIYENLGIEAARATLFREIFTLFEQAAPVNYRHIALLCDAMTNRGRMVSADRIGVNKKTKIGALAKASFEQTEDIMLKAAMFGEMDPVTSVASNIMTGQPIRGGTSFTQILLDESAMKELIATAPPPKRTVERAPQLVQEQIERILEAPQMPGCRQEDLRIPAALPPMNPGTVAPTDLPELEIVLVDE